MLGQLAEIEAEIQINPTARETIVSISLFLFIELMIE